MKQYDNYKNSGVEWLGEIPEHWEVKKMKFIGKIYAGINGKKGDDFSKEYSNGLKSFIPFTNICNNTKISESKYQYVNVDDKENQNRVIKNDILFLMSSETIEDIAKCSIYTGNDKELYLNSFCKGFRIKNHKVYPEYINYLLLSITYKKYFTLVGRGFTRINIKQEYINDVFTLLPPVEEQTAIANFLDNKTALIDKAIALKEKQIELLKEHRQILIHRAVTRGLNPDVKLKDSGVEWIGEIPEHWEVVPIRRLIDVRDGTHDTPLYIDNVYESYPLITSKDFEGDIINFTNTRRISKKDHLNIAKRSGVKRGDVLMSMIGGNIGKSVIINEDNEFSVKNVALFITRNNLYLAKYLRYYFESGLLNKQIELKSRGGAQGFLSLGDIRNLIFFKIPESEIIEIIIYLDRITSQKISTAITLKEKEIEKLKEYKSVLINEAVSGKIKVG